MFLFLPFFRDVDSLFDRNITYSFVKAEELKSTHNFEKLLEANTKFREAKVGSIASTSLQLELKIISAFFSRLFFVFLFVFFPFLIFYLSF